MIVTLKVPDEVYEKYAEFNKQNPRGAMEKQLVRFQDHEPSSRFVILEPEIRRDIEKIHSLEDQRKFVTWLQGQLSIFVADVQVPLRENQLRCLTAEATSKLKDVKEHIRTRVRNALDREFGPS